MKLDNDSKIFYVVSFIVCIFAVYLLISGLVEGAANDPNRPTDYYDVTCEFRLQNNILFDVSIMDQFNGKAATQCYSAKSSLFSVQDSFSLLWPSDKGTVKLSIDNKNNYQNYDVDEGSTQVFKMTVKRIMKGEKTVNIVVNDPDGKLIDGRSFTITVGDA